MKKWKYGLLYLLLIPVFALIYTVLPDGLIEYGVFEKSFLINLYYSAVTITTLGYGDITPKCEAAALLVGLEAVLGVVVIGLFLNQIAHNQMSVEKQAEETGEENRAKLRECDRLLQYADVIQQIRDKDELEDALRDFILNIDMHDFRNLERICLIYLTNGNREIFRKQFDSEVEAIKVIYLDLKSQTGEKYWS